MDTARVKTYLTELQALIVERIEQSVLTQVDRYVERELAHRFQRDEAENTDAFKILGRGELQLAILIEMMRREGYELMVGKPEIVTRTHNGKLQEPVEQLIIDVPQEFVGVLMQEIGVLSRPNVSDGPPRQAAHDASPILAPAFRKMFRSDVPPIISVSRPRSTSVVAGTTNVSIFTDLPCKMPAAARKSVSLPPVQLPM